MINSVATYTGRLAPDLWHRYLAIVLDGLSVRRESLSVLPDAPTDAVVEEALLVRKGG
jgi:hypothetical protein